MLFCVVLLLRVLAVACVVCIEEAALLSLFFIVLLHVGKQCARRTHTHAPYICSVEVLAEPPWSGGAAVARQTYKQCQHHHIKETNTCPYGTQGNPCL